MKAYIYHTYDICPWFIVHEVEETKDRFILHGNSGWPKGKDCRVKKITRKRYDFLKAEGERILSEYRAMQSRLIEESKALFK